MMKTIASIDESAIGDCIGMTPTSSEWSCVVMFGDGFTMFHEFCMVSGSVIHTLLKVVNFTVCSIVSCVGVQTAIPIGVSFYGIVVALCVIVIVIPAPSRKPISAFVLYGPQFKSVCALSTHVLRHTPLYCNEVIGNVIETVPKWVSIIVFHPCCPPFDMPRANLTPFLAVHNNHDTWEQHRVNKDSPNDISEIEDYMLYFVAHPSFIPLRGMKLIPNP